MLLTSSWLVLNFLIAMWARSRLEDLFLTAAGQCTEVVSYNLQGAAATVRQCGSLARDMSP